MTTGFGWIDLCPHTKLAAFVDHLRAGELMASRCVRCGATAFPPRADCIQCLHEEFEFAPIRPQGTVLTFTTITAAPAGFEDQAPYVLGVVELDDGGRLLAWFGDSIAEADIAIGLRVDVVVKIAARGEDTRVLYTLERPHTRARSLEGRR